MYPFLDQGQLATAYGAADVAVTRASAGVLTELSYAGKPMIVVPLPGSANDHQLINASEMGRFGAVVMNGANISVQVLLSQLDRMLEPATYTDISTRIKAFAKPDAADKIALTISANRGDLSTLCLRWRLLRWYTYERISRIICSRQLCAWPVREVTH